MMANVLFICLNHVPIYLIQYHSECFSEGVFWMRLTFKSLISKLTQTAEGTEKRLTSPSQTEILHATSRLELEYFLMPPAWESILKILNLPALSDHMNQFLK